MPYFNDCQILGHAGKDPSLEYLQSGQALCKFSVAVSRGKEKPTDWFNIVAFGKTAEIAAEQVKKGSIVLIKGAMQSNKYEEKTYWNLMANRIYVFAKNESSPPPSNDIPEDLKALGRVLDLDDVDLVD